MAVTTLIADSTLDTICPALNQSSGYPDVLGRFRIWYACDYRAGNSSQLSIGRYCAAVTKGDISVQELCKIGR